MGDPLSELCNISQKLASARSSNHLILPSEVAIWHMRDGRFMLTQHGMEGVWSEFCNTSQKLTSARSSKPFAHLILPIEFATWRHTHDGRLMLTRHDIKDLGSELCNVSEVRSSPVLALQSHSPADISHWCWWPQTRPRQCCCRAPVPTPCHPPRPLRQTWHAIAQPAMFARA